MFRSGRFYMSLMTRIRFPHQQHYSSTPNELTEPMKTVSISSEDLKRRTPARNFVQLPRDYRDFFDSVAQSRQNMNVPEILRSLRTLFLLQKNSKTPIDRIKLHTNTEFKFICTNLRRQCRHLTLNDIIEALKILNYLEVQPDSEICLTLLNLIRHQINDVTLGHIIFLDFLLAKMPQTPLVEALQMALPMLLQIQLGTKIDYDNVGQLTELLQYVAKHQLPEKCMMNIVTALIMQGPNGLTVDQANSIIWSMCDLKYFNENCQKLLNNCVNVLLAEMSQLPYDRLVTTVSKIIERTSEYDLDFYNERLFEACANEAVRRNVGVRNGTYLLHRFNKLSFIHMDLTNYLMEEISKNPGELLQMNSRTLFSLIQTLSTCNYKSTISNWDLIKSTILQHPAFETPFNPKLPWVWRICELLSIDCYDHKIIENLFDSEFLRNFSLTDTNVLDYVQLLTCYQAVTILYPKYGGVLPSRNCIKQAININLSKQECPLTTYLHHAFGGEEFVVTGAQTEHGHYINHVISFDENGEPVPIKVDPLSIGYSLPYFEEISKKYTSNRTIAILSFAPNRYALNIPILKGRIKLNVQTMEALNIDVVVINMKQWTQLPDHEKIPYLEREVRWKLSQ